MLGMLIHPTLTATPAGEPLGLADLQIWTRPLADLGKHTRRWLIELLFKVLKSGCRFEDRQLETAKRLQRCLIVDLVVAWRILYMTTVGRQQPHLACTALFEDDEWKALYCYVNQTTQLPQEVPTLQTVVRMVAKLGGFLGRKHDGEPGIKTFWLGLHRLTDITAAWRLFNPQLKKSRKSYGSCEI